MDQILDKFVDDAKQKCEEAQRLTVMHINAMAALWKLKVEVKERGLHVVESDAGLLANSCRLYMESLSLAEANATPTLAIGDATLSGSRGFSSAQEIVRRGSSSVIWRTASGRMKEPWVTIEFEGAARKITELRLRPMINAPPWSCDQAAAGAQESRLRPKECVLQVASAALGGAFVEVASLLLPDVSHDAKDIAWVRDGSFRTNKSKSWRILLKSFYNEDDIRGETPVAFTGLDFELFEADIASDPLQRLHSLHNASLAFESLISQVDSSTDCELVSNLNMCTEEMEAKVLALNNEATKIENLYMEVARATHTECMIRLKEGTTLRKAKLEELKELSRCAGKKMDSKSDVWDDEWWTDFLCHVLVNGKTYQEDVCEKLLHDLEGVLSSRVEIDSLDRDKVKFPEFTSIEQFHTALLLRLGSIRTGLGKDLSRKSRAAAAAAAAAADATGSSDPFVQLRSSRFCCAKGLHNTCMEAISKLPSRPSISDVHENAHCNICKADWFQTGPTCSHCKLHESLRDLAPDQVTLTVLSSLHGIVRSPLGISLLKMKNLEAEARISARAKTFFEVLEAEKRERALAYRAWRVHLDLLNDHDELNQCKTAMRLTYEGEDVTLLTSDKLNAVVQPVDLAARFHMHAAKQVMAQGELRRSKDTLRYLRNLSQESKGGTNKSTVEQESCTVCLAPFEPRQYLAVLNCGHRFHNEPCYQQLQARRSGTCIRCPMRCPQTTPVNGVLIACSDDAKAADGVTVGTERRVKGSWGTKVTRLVADVLGIRDGGEKGVIFSQWEDMLNIVEQALTENGIELVRPSGAKRIGDAVRRFRSSSCSVLLLNVKNGGEGLTLIEATHVFMVEPLLDCGLDSQGRLFIGGELLKHCGSRFSEPDSTIVQFFALPLPSHQSYRANRPNEDDNSVEIFNAKYDRDEDRRGSGRANAAYR
jgi:E3 ubiquitin-protein ligase SHPRH